MNGHSSRRLSRRALLAGATAALAARASATQAQTLTSLAVAGVPEDSATPVLYAASSGLFRRSGLDVQLTGERSGPAIASGVAGGAYQIGKASVTPLILGHSKGLPFVLVAPGGIYTTAAPIDGMFVRADSPYKTAADLNGKTFAVYGIGDIYTISTKLWMDKNGGDSTTIKLVEIPISAMVEAIATGRVDAGSMNEPALQLALSSPRLRQISHPFAAVAARFMYTAWFAMAGYAADHRAAMVAFNRAVRDAAAYTNAHHEQTVDLIATFSAVDPAVIRKMTRVEQGTVLDPQLIQPVIDAMARVKDIPAAFDARDLIAPSLR